MNRVSRIPRKMKTAVCISGQCRSLNKTCDNIRRNLLDPLGDCDVFMYVSEDAYSRLASLLNPRVLKIVEDQHIDEGDLVNGENCRLKTGVQPYLQQLYALKMCNILRLSYEKQMYISYDCVIRSRPDIMFTAALPNIEDLDLDNIYLPDFHHFDGCNDRFAIGNPANMNVYFNKFDCFQEYVHDYLKTKGVALSAEMFTILHLQKNNIPTKTLPIRFNRVRSRRITDDLKKTCRKIKLAI
ncbi:hypothetical protein ACFL9U_08610 [Thermodesulfobacteriota bacterium]